MFNLETINISFITKMLKFLFHYTLLCYIIHKPLQQLLSLYRSQNSLEPWHHFWRLGCWIGDVLWFCYQISNILRIFREETNSKSFLATSCDFLMNVSLCIQLNDALKCSILKLYALIKFVLTSMVCLYILSYVKFVHTQKYINYDVISTINHCTAATFKFKLKWSMKVKATFKQIRYVTPNCILKWIS